MANGAWRIYFEATTIFITRTGPAAFATTVVTPTSPPRARPPAGTPAIVRVRVRIRDDGKGSPPVAPGAAPIDATLRFVSRRVGATNFTPLGDAVGKIAYVKSGTTDVPKFTCGTRRLPGPPGTVVKTEPNFTPSSAVAVARSDWMLRLEPHPDHFELPVVSSLPLPLAWDC